MGNVCDIFYIGGMYNSTIPDNSTIIEDVNNLENFTDGNHRSYKGREFQLLGATSVDEEGKLYRAGAFQLSLRFDSERIDRNATLKWEKAVENVYISDDHRGQRFDNFKVQLFTSTSLDDAAIEAKDADLWLMIFSFMIMFAYVFIAHLRPKYMVQSQTMAGLSGAIATIMGICTGFGVAAAMQIPYTSMTGIAPFLIVGIGIDDTFIILHEVSIMDPKLDPKATVTMAMGNCGPSILMTTLTDVIALIVGTSSLFPAVQYFCAYTAVAIIFVFLYQTTFTVACIILDVNRMRANRFDIIPCLKSKDANAYAHYRIPPKFGIHSILINQIVPAMLVWWVKIIIFILFFGLTIAASYAAATNLSIGLETKNLPSFGSAAEEFQLSEEAWFGSALRAVEITLTIRDLNYEEFEEDIDNLISRMTSGQCASKVLTKPDFWFFDFRDWYFEKFQKSSLPKEHSALSFLVKEFLRDFPLSAKHSQDINFDEDGNISATRLRLETGPIESFLEQGICMSVYRSMLDESAIAPTSFLWHPEFFFFEQSLVIVPQTILSLGLAAATVLVVTVLFLVIPWTAVFVLICIIMIDIDLFGLMALWDIGLDSIAMVNLIMAVGFAVDYSAHIAHAFMLAEGTRNERVLAAMNRIGISVFDGGTSTILATLPLAASSGYIFFTFFRVFFFAVLFGLLHGLVFLPTLLSVIGPCPIPRAAMITATPRNKKPIDSISLWDAPSFSV
eukprot:GHVL01013577.1.p1 GENE.GHVL01013577.1~~GHVL01013577.1.p1  ORF type:complete len:787 (-),score=100.18 GHVL01013577.1:108-2300(-)